LQTKKKRGQARKEKRGVARGVLTWRRSVNIAGKKRGKKLSRGARYPDRKLPRLRGKQKRQHGQKCYQKPLSEENSKRRQSIIEIIRERVRRNPRKTNEKQPFGILGVRLATNARKKNIAKKRRPTSRGKSGITERMQQKKVGKRKASALRSQSAPRQEGDATGQEKDQSPSTWNVEDTQQGRIDSQKKK